MTRPTLYYWEPNANPAKAMFLFAEKGVSYEGHYVDLLGMEQHTPAYLALNPKGTIPTLVNGEQILTESTPMMEYIDATFDGPVFTPSDPVERWRMRWWMRFFDSYLCPAISMPAWKRIFTPILEQRDASELTTALSMIPDEQRRLSWRKAMFDEFTEAELAESQRRYLYGLKVLEQHLADSPWVACASYSLADINGFTLGYAFPMIQPENCNESKTPHIMSWLKRIYTRPAIIESFKLGRTEMADRAAVMIERFTREVAS
jgi:GSH-dependent disulfide-bond oxidoreductase